MKPVQATIQVEAPPRENRQCGGCRFNYTHFVDMPGECELFGVTYPPGVADGERTCLFRQPAEDLQGQVNL